MLCAHTAGETADALKSPEYLKIHPFGRVPSLKTDKVTLFETAAICRYIDEVFDGPALLPATPEGRAVADQWMCALSCYILAQAINGYAIHFVRAMRQNKTLEREFAETECAKIAGHMDILNTRLARVPYLAGDRFTIPDIMLAPAIQALAQMPGTDEIIARQDHINAWYDRVKERPSFTKVHSRD